MEHTRKLLALTAFALTLHSGAFAQKENVPRLLYMGQASIRITTEEGRVIYIDPYAGSEEQYEPTADLILVTHGHFDHNQIEKVKNRAYDCRIITHRQAIVNGKHQSFDLGFVKVETVEAGYNRMHNPSECVGYILTFKNGASVYVTGDTSKTPQMSQLSKKQITYAFFCCDGIYNMDLEEAAECASLVGAKYNIPYHNTASTRGKPFDKNRAEAFNAPNRLIVDMGEEIVLEN